MAFDRKKPKSLIERMAEAASAAGIKDVALESAVRAQGSDPSPRNLANPAAEREAGRREQQHRSEMAERERMIMQDRLRRRKR